MPKFTSKCTTIEQVQKRVGKLPAPRDLKVIDYIDEHAMRWLSYASFGFLAFGKSGQLELTSVGGEKGFASVPNAGQVNVPLAALDDASIVDHDMSFGALFMVSGMDESLRINGRVSRIEEEHITLNVEECYLHCAKAFRRSNFWQPESIEHTQGEIPDFIKQSTFLVLASMNSRGHVDVSPKGDPGGSLLQEVEGVFCFADRPGNRRIDSFRNIIEQPEVCIIALMPGYHEMIEIKGTAALYTDESLLERFVVQGKQPKLTTSVTASSIKKTTSQAITSAKLWPAQRTPEDLVPSEIFKAHIKHSKENSLQAKVARAAVSLPGAMENGLALDYKKNMY